MKQTRSWAAGGSARKETGGRQGYTASIVEEDSTGSTGEHLLPAGPSSGPRPLAGSSPLSSWPQTERPRERRLRHGAAALSNAELLAILLRSGTRGHSAVTLGLQLLANSQDSLSRLLSTDPARLMRMDGLGPARATTLAVVIELAHRALREQMQTQILLNQPAIVQDYLGLRLRGLSREVFLVLFVNTQHRLIETDTLFSGTLNQTAVYPREVLKRALDLNAAAVILAHNHPSGQPEPSQADIRLTRTLRDALAQVDIRVLDHIIVAGERQYSFALHNML